MNRVEVEKIVKFVKDNNISFSWKGKEDFSEGEYVRSVYDRRSQLLPKSKEHHDEEVQWWIDQYLNDTSSN